MDSGGVDLDPDLAVKKKLHADPTLVKKIRIHRIRARNTAFSSTTMLALRYNFRQFRDTILVADAFNLHGLGAGLGLARIWLLLVGCNVVRGYPENNMILT